MATAQPLLRPAGITVEVVDGAAPDARACRDAYADDIDARFPEGFDKSDLAGHAPLAHRGAGDVRACGYTEIPAYADHVYAGHWFEKRLPNAPVS